LTQPLKTRAPDPQLEDAAEESVVTEFSEAISIRPCAAPGRPINARHNSPLPRTSYEKCSANGKTLGLMPSAAMKMMFLGGAPDFRAA
jgi:hypothetical protein